MVACRRTCEAVVTDSKIAKILAGELVVSLRDLTRRDALSIGRDHHRRSVLVRSARHDGGRPSRALRKAPAPQGRAQGGGDGCRGIHATPPYSCRRPRAARGESEAA